MSIILIGTDNRCLCDCATKCVLGRGGSAPRGTKIKSFMDYYNNPKERKQQELEYKLRLKRAKK